MDILQNIQRDPFICPLSVLDHTTQYQYDAAGRVIGTIYDDDSFTQTIYDSQGRKVAEIDPMNRRTDYGYDNSGRLTDVYQPAVEDALTKTLVRPHWQYTYDSQGNPLSQTDPNGHTTGFTYDAQGNRLSRTLPESQSESWTYDDLGRVDVRQKKERIPAGKETFSAGRGGASRR